MILKTKAVSLPEGEHFFASVKSAGEIELYYNKGGMKKKKISLGQIVRCENQQCDYDCDAVIDLGEHLCLCQGTNFSIIDK